MPGKIGKKTGKVTVKKGSYKEKPKKGMKRWNECQ